MRIQEMTGKSAWNAYVATNGPRSGAFLQSWEWGEFQKTLGRKVNRLGFYEDEASDRPLAMAAQGIRMPLPLGFSYWYVPRGPVPASKSLDVAVLRETLGVAGKDAKASFVRFDPPLERAGTVTWSGLTPSLAIQPADTLITDLSLDAETLLGRMHHKTRYNIRLAEKKGVKIEIGAAVSFESVWQIFQATSFRGAFHLHPRPYYEAMLAALNEQGAHAFLAIARYKNEVIAANLMIDFAGVRTYLHGASGDTHRNVMAPFLLHWALMEDAKAKGLRWYDWWGVSPAGASERHPWAGVTRFKMGWAGERVSYPGTFDLVLDKGLYGAYEMARKFVRRFR